MKGIPARQTRVMSQPEAKAMKKPPNTVPKAWSMLAIF
jgi:hypothetical protein